MSLRLSRAAGALASAVVLMLIASGTASGAGLESAATKGSAMTIWGGQTQSYDPTAYDYVPAAGSGVIQPMSASGVAYVSAFNYSWQGFTIPVPSGYIIHQIDGTGLSIKTETAFYSPSPAIGGIWGINICNWRIDFQNRSSANNSIVSTRVGTTHAGCNVTGVGRSLSNFTVKQGTECARLYVNGSFRGEQCHSVF